MRVLVAGLLMAALFAGCFDSGEKNSTPEQPIVPTNPDGLLTSDPNSTVIPAEFRSGFRVDSISLGVRGPEPNVGVTPSGAVFVTALGDIYRSKDAGLTWERVYQMAVGQTADPMLWVDPVTGRILSPQMFPPLVCSSFIKSDDDGATWLEIPGASCGSPGVDHQKVASGPYPKDFPLSTNPLYPNLVSYCYNKIVGTICAISLDGGIKYAYESIVDINTLVPTVELAAADCGGLNGHQHHAHDGTIYIPYGFNCGQAVVAVSTDGARSWTIRKLGVPNVALDPEITSTPDGTAYMLYKSVDEVVDGINDGRVYLIRSKDRFVTYDGPFVVSPPGVQTTSFMGMTAGSDGRIAMGYLGTSDGVKGGLEDDVGPNATWNAYVTMGVNADAPNPNFVTVQVNPANDPVQRGSICQNRTCTGGNRNLLDFVDLHAGPDGRFYFAYADGCVSDKCKGPSGTPADSRAGILTVARLAIGPSLYTDKPAFTG